uniref:Cytochrome P450 CYP71-5 n=1 Tax=Euphorbia poissonii TaxID=212962 RepID=A0A977LFQ9_9ROSI|nr:cytochrome P450 CYP71-5 [Euphorbia poissonii]
MTRDGSRSWGGGAQAKEERELTLIFLGVNSNIRGGFRERRGARARPSPPPLIRPCIDQRICKVRICFNSTNYSIFLPVFMMENQFLPSPIMLLASSLFFILALLKIWKISTSNTPLNLPPGPTKLPVIGNIHQLIGYSPHRRLRYLANQYGSIMHLQLGQVMNTVISSPEAAMEVMKTHDIAFAQRPSLSAAVIISYDSSDIVFAPYSDYWKQVRKLCVQELLSTVRVQSFRSIREEEGSKLIHAIASCSGKPFNFSRKIFSSAYGMVGRAAFGEKCKEQEEFIPLAEEIARALGEFNLADLFPSFKFLRRFSGISTIERLHKATDRIIENIINDRRAAKKSLKAEEKGEENNLLDVLLRLQEDGDLEIPLTDNKIKAVISDVFIAGSETSSTAIEWAMSELLRNPRVMHKAQEEVRRVYGKKGKVDESELHQLDYLKLVIKETLRLYPPAPLLLPRQSRESCKINGYDIPINSHVIINAWAIGRHPNHWKEAEKFHPERFTDSSVDFKGNSFEFIPFGAGRRMCPGIAFATANIELSLAQFLYHFDWQLPNGMKLESLDMAEGFGATMRRKNDLHLIPILVHSPSY